MHGATEEALRQLALQIEAQTKVNIRDNDQVDTGFMMNSVYTVTEKGSGYGEAKASAEGQATNRAGEHVDHSEDMGPEPPLGDATAAVAVGALYAIYQEAKRSFLYAALQEVVPKFGGIVKLVRR